MMSMPVSLIVEVTLAVLLAATLFSCARLDRRLRNLRKDQDSLSITVGSLNSAVAAAQASLAGLRAAAQEAEETLGRKLSGARGLADELSVLTSAGERIASRMENARAHQSRGPSRVAAGLSEALRAVR
jgi:chromosome segregation ATPase